MPLNSLAFLSQKAMVPELPSKPSYKDVKLSIILHQAKLAAAGRADNNFECLTELESFLPWMFKHVIGSWS